MSDAGYGIYEAVFAAPELAPAAEALERWPATRSRAGARHVLALPEVRSLATDPRMLALAAQFVGDALPFRATLFDKSAAANWLVVWHQDTALPMQARAEADGWGPWSTKAGVLYAHAPASALARIVALRVGLDASSDRSGPPPRPARRVHDDDGFRARPRAGDRLTASAPTRG